MKPNEKHTLRAVSHPGMLALDGVTVRIQTQDTGDGGTRISFVDPNTGATLASVGLVDGPVELGTFAYCAIRCTQREQGASYKRKGE